MNLENKSVFLIFAAHPIHYLRHMPVPVCTMKGKGARQADTFIMRGPGEFPSVKELIKGSELVVESANVIYPLSSFVVLFITLRTWHESLIYIFIYFNLGKSVQMSRWGAVTLPWPRLQRLQVSFPQQQRPRAPQLGHLLLLGPPLPPWSHLQVQERGRQQPPRLLWPR